MPNLDKVCIIGWSYGGFLSALAVLDAPDVFKAACAGAPPTDWTLYDTHYTERYLGLDPDVYYRNGIVQDAPKLTRPLMLIHGFADDNVTIAHSLRLSQALMAAGRPAADGHHPYDQRRNGGRESAHAPARLPTRGAVLIPSSGAKPP